MKILCALACDDVRQESNRKHILIGVYGPKIRVNALPGVLRMAYYFQFEASQDELEKEIAAEVRLVTRINVGAENEIMSGKFGLNFSTESVAIVATPQFPVAMEKEGTVIFQLREQGKRWKTILSRDVSIDKSLKSTITFVPPTD